MEVEFEQILALIEKLNKSSAEATPSFVDLQEEKENIKDLFLLDQDTKKVLDQLKKIDNLTIDEIMEQVCYLNTYLNTYIWHTESIRDTIQKIIYYKRFKI